MYRSKAKGERKEGKESAKTRNFGFLTLRRRRRRGVRGVRVGEGKGEGWRAEKGRRWEIRGGDFALATLLVG